MPPKQPIDLLLHKGNKHFSKKEIEERKAQEIKAPSDKVKPPAYLPKELKKEFKVIADQLLEIGIISNLDVDSLARFLISQQLYLDISLKLLQCDPLSHEYDQYMKHADKLFKQCRQGAADLGLTISSRCKLAVPSKKEEKKEESDEQKRFGGRL